MQTETHAPTNEVLPREQSVRRGESNWKWLALILIFVLVCEHKSKTIWLPVAGSQQMCVLVSDWWGLKVQAYYPVWKKPTGETGEYSEQWCIQYPDSTWRVFYGGRGKSSAYTYPPLTTYSTYF